MALFPCAVGSHRYAGPQRSAYLGVASGGLSARSKLRLCPKHFQALSDYCEEALTLIVVGETETGNDEDENGFCRNHSDQPGEYKVYATLYPLKDEARIYFSAACQDCSDAFRRIGQIELS